MKTILLKSSSKLPLYDVFSKTILEWVGFQDDFCKTILEDHYSKTIL